MEVSQGEEPKKECKTCRKQIDSSRHRMHEMGCMRQNYWCNVCEAAVSKTEKEEHEETMHAMKSCQFCGLQMMAMKIDEHEASCDAQPTGCKYCDEKLAPAQMAAHIDICASKTDVCPDCGDFVKRTEKRDHKQEGFCEIIQISKREGEEAEAQKEKERHQAKLLQDWDKNEERKVTAPPKQSSLLSKPKPQPMPAAPTQVAQPDLSGMSAYEQMLFQQFADGNDGADAIMGGAAGGNDADLAAMQAMQSELAVRKADSAKQSQLIGGDDDESYYGGRIPGRQMGPGGLAMQRQPAVQQNVVRPDPSALWQPTSLDDVFAAERNSQPAATSQSFNPPSQSSMPLGGQQNANNNADGFGDADIPAEEMDPELQAILELSKNIK